MQGAQRVAWADNAIKLAVDMTVAGIGRLNLQGNAEQQSEEMRAAMTRLFPEAVTLVREAREGSWHLMPAGPLGVLRVGGTRCAAWLYRPGRGRRSVRGDGPRFPRRARAAAGRLRGALRRGRAGRARFRLSPLRRQRGRAAPAAVDRSQLEDWRAAVAHARSLDGIDPKRIALWGTSFSGGHVVATAARDPKIAAVVSQAPFTDGPTAILANSPAGMHAHGHGRASRRRCRAAGPRSVLHARGRPARHHRR